MSSFISNITDAVQNSAIGAIAQELGVLTVFVVSFVLWRTVSDKMSPKRGKSPKLASASHFPATGTSQCETQQSTKATSPGMRMRPTGRSIASEAAQPHVKAAEQQMLKMLEAREFTRALNMYRALERDGRDQYFMNEDLFSGFIQSAIRVGKVDVVERMLRVMKRNGIAPSLKFWQATLRMLSSRKHFSTCFSVHSLWGKDLPADKIVFSCLINAALENGAADRAAAMLDSYGKADLEPRDYVLFFRTYVATGDVDAAEATVRKLGPDVTTLMLNLLLLTCVNGKQPDRALDRLRDAHVLEEGKAERIVDTVSYNTVIKGFAQASESAKCMACLRDMREKSLEPDDVTFGTLLDLCILGNNLDKAHEITDILVNGDRPMDTVMCTLFIKGLVRANCLPKAMELYEDMKTREHSHPDLITFSVLIKACVDTHEFQRALTLVEDMKTAGHQPDDIIFTHLLEGCRHEGNAKLGKKLFQEMLDNKVQPSEFTLITMVKLLGRCGAHDEARELVDNWEKDHGMKPSVIHFTCLVSGCLRMKNYQQGWQAYELMCKHGVTPDGTALATLLPGMIAAQMWDNAMKIVRSGLTAPTPIPIPTESLNSLLSQMLLAHGLGRHVAELRELMKNAGIQVTARNLKRVV